MLGTRSRPGYTLVGTLVVVVILGYLYTRQMAAVVKPRSTAVSKVDPKVAAAMPDEARLAVFRTVCEQVRTAVSMYENVNGEGPKPRSWADLAKMGMNTSMRDPWEGQYYLKDGFIRCTGNPKVWEKL